MFGNLSDMNSNLSAKNNRDANNFDMLRLVMAVTVFLFHLYVLTGESDFKIFTTFLSSAVAINCFFIISGFLIFMSYENSKTLKSYAEKRLRRIAPAYILVVTVCLLAGMFITELPVSDYFSLELLKYYVFNILTLNFLEPSLPGLFGSNLYSAVNGSLWTIKIEVMFYFSVPLIVYLFGRFNKFVVCAVLYSLSVIYYLGLNYMFDSTGVKLYQQFGLLLPGSLSFFMAGGVLYYYLDWFKKRPHLYGILGMVGFVIYKFTAFYFILPISLALIVVYIAIGSVNFGNFARYGDFSYGVYIWHYPVIQTLIVFEAFRNPWEGFVYSLGIVFLLSILSWHFIEKPTLRKTSHYVLVGK